MRDRSLNEPQTISDNEPNNEYKLWVYDYNDYNNLLPNISDNKWPLKGSQGAYPYPPLNLESSFAPNFNSPHHSTSPLINTRGDCVVSWSPNHPHAAIRDVEVALATHQSSGLIPVDGDNNPSGYHPQPQGLSSKKLNKRPSSSAKSAKARQQKQRCYQPSEGSDSSSERPFACPFYMWNNERYSDCRAYRLRRIRDVKQHVYRIHTKPNFYCPICYGVFGDAESRDKHIQEKPCVPRPDPFYDGISEDQRKQLGPPRGRTIEEQWYNIWYIIFPQVHAPKSPYLHTYREEMSSMIQSFLNDNKFRIIHETIRAESTPSTDHAYLARMMDKLVTNFGNEAARLALPYEKSSFQSLSMNYWPGYELTQQSTPTTSSHEYPTAPSTDLEWMSFDSHDTTLESNQFVNPRDLSKD
ncbi:hypothetical protein F4810DRAFT_659238 [Camillea tinctor]|nr:hypothetical protein F4810DRAFT_659238 [Camillea tinctor]